MRSHFEKETAEVYISRYMLSDFNVPWEVDEWFNRNIGVGPREGKSLILWGPTRVGKTQLARVLGVHWYINVDWDVNQIRGDVQYGILDDMDVKQFKYWKAFIWCQ